MLLDELNLRFLAHRKQAFVTCDETCFCWEIESLLAELDSHGPTLRVPVQHEQKCPSCEKGKLEAVVQCDFCFQVFDETDISNRSVGG